jgi:hypothetical protein
MRSDTSRQDLDQLVQLARAAEPPELSPLHARRMVRAAVEHEAPVRVPKAQRHLRWLGALAALLVLAVLTARILMPRGTSIEVAVSERPLHLALLPGDAVTVAPGARLALLSQVPARRQVRLERGAALFDVVPLGKSQVFEVDTEHVQVRVLGTVFSVEVADGRTLVRVYEGRVQVGGRVLGPREVWSSNGTPPSAVLAPLSREAENAVKVRENQRAGVPATLVSPLPTTFSVPPAALPEPAAAANVQGLPATASLTEARAWLEAGETERALAAARRPHGSEPALPWRLLEAAALRALGRFDEAISSYEQSAAMAPSPDQEEAGYSAAALALHGLKDPARALAITDRFDLDADASPLRERASLLRVDALLALGRTRAAKVAAQRYLNREPDTATSQQMRKLLGW